jgi:hypothetical protein
VLLVRAGVTTRSELAQVRTILRAGATPLVGAVLTRAAVPPRSRRDAPRAAVSGAA